MDTSKGFSPHEGIEVRGTPFGLRLFKPKTFFSGRMMMCQ